MHAHGYACGYIYNTYALVAGATVCGLKPHVHSFGAQTLGARVHS